MYAGGQDWFLGGDALGPVYGGEGGSVVTPAAISLVADVVFKAKNSQNSEGGWTGKWTVLKY